jgi:ferredoxin/flavodoxin
MKTILYFSPTGNVRYVAQLLLDKLAPDSAEMQPLEFTDPRQLRKTDHLIIMYSIHAFNAPRTVRKFVDAMPQGLCSSVSIISIGCAESWVNEAASESLVSRLMRKGYLIGANRQFAMPLTFIMAFPDETVRKLLVAIEEKIDSLIPEINSQEPARRDISAKSRVLSFLGRAEGPAARLLGVELHADKNCTSCGICVRRCPEQNIRFNSKEKPVFGLNCLMCMRCIYECPEKSISPRFSKFIPIKNGYNIMNHVHGSDHT